MIRRNFVARVLTATFLGRFIKIREDKKVLFYIHKGNIEHYKPPFPGKVWDISDGEYYIGTEEEK